MSHDVIQITLPANPDYIVALKLAVSAVAERMGFNMDDIQDIKEVSAEGCNMLFPCEPESLNISITIQEDVLDMDIRAKSNKESVQKSDRKSAYRLEDEICESFLKMLTDECSFTRRGDTVTGVHFKRKCYPRH